MNKNLETGFASTESSIRNMERLVRSQHTELVKLISSSTASDGLHRIDAPSPSEAVVHQVLRMPMSPMPLLCRASPI